jgi:hypothetical protein
MKSINNNKNILFLLGCMMSISSSLAYAQDGASLFYENCARCHRDGPRSVLAPANKLEDILKSGSIRQHRFNLTNEEISIITDYINNKKK